ncbi:MAG: serine hydrolase domain-containing protein [Rhodanobacter sp.]
MTDEKSRGRRPVAAPHRFGVAPCLAAALALAALPGWAPRADARDASDQAARIAAVEQGLRPAIVLRGQPVPTRTLAEEMASLHIPGVSIAVIHDSRIAWAKGYGVTREGGPAVTPNTLFQAGSISKPVAAVGALRLVDAGKLGLDEDVNAYLKHWKVPTNAMTARHPVTLRELLSHTAGTNVHGFPGYPSTAPLPDTLQVLDGRPPANTPPIRVVIEPGRQWSYSGGGYTIAQQLVADVTGTPFDTWMQAHVLDVAGMARSSFAQPLPAGLLAHAAMPHEADGTPVAGGPHRYPAMAAAGLWTTPSDLARWLIDIQRSLAGREGGLLSPAMARRMLAPVKPGQSMGFEVGGSGNARYFAKSGDTEGFGARLVAYGPHGDGAVVMANGALGPGLAEDVVRSIAHVYGWPDFRSQVRAATALDPATLANYAGTYRFGEGRLIVIALDHGHLTLGTPGEPSDRLYAASANTLFVLTQALTVEIDGDSRNPVQFGHLVLGGQSLPFHRVPPTPP